MESISERPYTFFRLSPVERSTALCFGLQRGEVAGRIDVNFWRLTPLLRQRLEKPRFPLVELRDVVDVVQYGCSTLASAEPIGFPILRMNNLQNDGWDLKDLKYIEMSQEGLETYGLKVGDILFNRTNSKELVGKCEVFRETGDWVFASYLIRVRLKSGIIPQFVSDFLSTSAGRLQIDRFSRQIIGMTNINAEELRQILIPLPQNEEKQHEFVLEMDRARKTRSNRMEEAALLLSDLDNLLLKTVGLNRPPDSQKVFAIRSRELVNALNPERYRGMQLEKHLPFKTTVANSGKLVDERCAPSREAPQAMWDWIRIDDLPNQPWQVERLRTELGKDISGAFFEVQENDILLARLGPTILNAKFVLCPKLLRRTVASSEFLVIRCPSGRQAAAVLWLLRTSLYREILYARSRGATPSRFRLDGNDLLTIPFPQMDEKTQSNVAEEVRRRREAALRLRSQAEDEWQRAKEWFEEQLLGPK